MPLGPRLRKRGIRVFTILVLALGAIAFLAAIPSDIQPPSNRQISPPLTGAVPPASWALPQEPVPAPSSPAGDVSLPPADEGMAPVITRVPTSRKVVFLTIDDGAVKDPRLPDLLRTHRVRATLFLARVFISDDPGYFKVFTETGSLVEDHTSTHPLNLIQLNYSRQKDEICGMADYEAATYGRRPVFFRPPGGPYTASIREAAWDCGLKAVIDWQATVDGGTIHYQSGNDRLRPGDIVLMHFRKTFEADLNAFLDAQRHAGLDVELLEDFYQIH